MESWLRHRQTGRSPALNRRPPGVSIRKWAIYKALVHLQKTTNGVNLQHIFPHVFSNVNWATLELGPWTVWAAGPTNNQQRPRTINVMHNNGRFYRLDLVNNRYVKNNRPWN